MILVKFPGYSAPWNCHLPKPLLYVCGFGNFFWKKAAHLCRKYQNKRPEYQILVNSLLKPAPEEYFLPKVASLQTIFGIFASAIMCSYNSAAVNSQRFSAYLKINLSKINSCYWFAEISITNKLNFEKSFKMLYIQHSVLWKQLQFGFEICYNSVVTKWWLCCESFVSNSCPTQAQFRRGHRFDAGIVSTWTHVRCGSITEILFRQTYWYRYVRCGLFIWN